MSGASQPKRMPECAPRVRRRQVERFYRACGEDLPDAEAVVDVGLSLYARCQSMLGTLDCPECSSKLDRLARSLHCPKCVWSCPWDDFRRTSQGKHLSPGRMRPFIKDYERANALGDKVILIDTLIHRYHGELEGGCTPGAYNLIEGELTDMAAFLDGITYAWGTPAEVVERREEWRRRLRSAPKFWSRQLGPSDESRQSCQ